MTETEKLDELAELVNKLSEVVEMLSERLTTLEESIFDEPGSSEDESTFNNEVKGHSDTR